MDGGASFNGFEGFMRKFCSFLTFEEAEPRTKQSNTTPSTITTSQPRKTFKLRVYLASNQPPAPPRHSPTNPTTLPGLIDQDKAEREDGGK